MKLRWYLLFTLLLVSCSKDSQIIRNEIKIELPENNNTDSLFISKIKSIKLLNFEVDTSYIYLQDRHTQLVAGNNYVFFLTRRLQLSCYDKLTGEKVFVRDIKGRAGNECVYVNSITTLGDTIILNDQSSCDIKMFNYKGKYCGNINTQKIIGQIIFPQANTFLCCDKNGSYYDRNYFLAKFDSSYNLKEKYFEIPDSYRILGDINIVGSPNIYMYKDTLRFMFAYTSRLHSYPGKTYHFVTSKPLTQSILNKCKTDKDIIYKYLEDGYEGSYNDLAENEHFISFKYYVNNKHYCALINKHNNVAISITTPSEIFKESGKINSLEIWRLMVFGSRVLYSDGTSFYAECNMSIYMALEHFQEYLDERQKQLFREMQDYVDKYKTYIDDSFQFYIKIETDCY